MFIIISTVIINVIIIFSVAARYDYPAKEYSNQEESKLLNYLMANYDRSSSSPSPSSPTIIILVSE